MAAFSGDPFSHTSGSHQRAFTRTVHEASLEQLVVWRPQQGWLPLEGRLVNLSAGGAGILVPEQLPEGTPVRFEVGIPSLRFGKEGRIAYARPEADLPGIWRVGVAFPPAPPSTTELLGARVVCWTAIVIVVSGFVSSAQTATETAGLALMLLLLGGLALGAELTYRQACGRYRSQRVRWESPA